METLISVQAASLTIYGMCKAVDRGVVMANFRVLGRHDVKSGD